MVHRTKFVAFLVIQLLVTLLFLAACTDTTPSNGVNPSPSSQIKPQSLTTGADNAPPTIPPPTPTYTPLPVTPTPAPTPTPPVIIGGKATGAVINGPLTLHPYKHNNASGEALVSLLFAATLTRLDPQTLQPAPNAAVSWSVSDTTTVTFVLRDGLKWSDGKPLTSADYLWTYQQLKKPENGWSLAPQAFFDPAQPGSSGIETYEAPDPRTVRVKLHSFSSDLVSRAAVIEPLPRQVWASLDWNDLNANPQANAPTVVSGPWKLKEWKRGSALTFERNPNSTVWPSSRLESLTFLILPDSQLALQKLQKGEIDFYSPAVTDWPAFSALSNVQAYTWGTARPVWYFAGFNYRRPVLQDKLFRQALAWSLDRRKMLDKAGGGLGRLINSSVSPWQPTFQPQTARYDLNLDKARALLKEAGYNFKDNKWYGKTGQALPTLKIIYDAPSPLYETLAATIKDNFAALGIAVDLHNYPFEDFRKLLVSPTADYDLFLSGWTADFAPENFGDVWRTIPALNSGAYDNSRLLDMYTKALNEADPAKRKTWLEQIQMIEAEELPYLFLYAEAGRLVANKRLAGFGTALLGPTANLYTDWFASR